MSQKLDQRFGHCTIAAKLTDVPGHTRGIISPLVDAGVSLLHIGINPASAVAEVPAIFHWRDSRDKEIIVVYQPDYGAMLEIPDGETGYLIVVGGDNTGAQSPETVISLLKMLDEKYPEAEITSATFNDLAQELMLLCDRLPLLTSEIGDSWIHGAGSDPKKVAHFRELCRFRQEENLENHDAFSRSLLLVAEHTWGLDEKKHFKNRSAWSAAELMAIASTPEVCHFAASWQEQRDYLTQAVAALPDNIAARAKQRLKDLDAAPLSLDVGQQSRFETVHFILELDIERNCIVRLCHKASGRELASSSRSLFLFALESFTAADMEHFINSYLRSKEAWALADFGKPGMPVDLPREITEGFPGLISSGYSDGAWHIVMTSKEPINKIGGFQKIILELTLPDSQPKIQAKLHLKGKSADRQPHAVWMEFHPAINCSFCQFKKLGELINAMDVVSGGGRALHAIDGNISWGSEQCALELNSLDAPLLAPGRKLLGKFPNTLPELNEGISINLYNNLWGTNFPMWFGDDTVFRWEIEMRSK